MSDHQSSFVCMDWDLQAIVGGGYNSTSVVDNHWPASSSCFAPNLTSLDHHHEQDGLFGFPDICETTTILDELEELYKPFYPQTNILTTTASISVPCTTTSTDQVVKKPKKQPLRKKQQPADLCSSSTSGDSTESADRETKPKKGRKNQHKRVVVQQAVTADGLSSDLWAWRKYGQKPIKGSPYPRSYYRCSSSKGCLARKQVEISRSDPGVNIITYSAEHNHAHPTRRSSLAGSTRNKSSLQRGPSTMIISEVPLQPTTTASNNNLVTSFEDQELIQLQDHDQENKIKQEEELQVLFEDIGEENEIAMPDIVFSDELFPSFEDFEGLLFDQFHSNFDHIR
ncbi:hypothetical protein Ddye_002728 [Dipteronia dyeriana]|uniref:WRKY domain-containing protein n=1 Tax=Dipteronia dyeriana TaxID=168575 RepID=A0AAD9XQY2_9ROSI|nr:hypothetical protein Ddye_002728 [Dipteronia dyeriana]